MFLACKYLENYLGFQLYSLIKSNDGQNVQRYCILNRKSNENLNAAFNMIINS